MARELELIPFPMNVTLALTEEEWIAICEKNEFKDRTWLSDNHTGDVTRYGSLAVVRFGDLSDFEIADRVGIYAHEASHVFQALCEQISERTASDEFNAYYIQRVTEWLFKESECFLSQASTSNLQEQLSLDLQSSGTSPETGQETTS